MATMASFNVRASSSGALAVRIVAQALSKKAAKKQSDS
jgi:hypothetical protein